MITEPKCKVAEYSLGTLTNSEWNGEQFLTLKFEAARGWSIHASYWFLNDDGTFKYKYGTLFNSREAALQALDKGIKK